MIWIGIDTGTHTGLAVWDDIKNKLLEVDTLPIHKALDKVKQYKNEGCDLLVIFEDARQRKWFGKGTRQAIEAKAQGAGSVKRDCAIWEDFLTDEGIAFRAVPPMIRGTKLKPDFFVKLTGWKGRTSNHARDATMLVFGK